MPELKRVFTSGKMNKDLDERLLPNGQYRDALNVQVSNSEGSNVGAIESVLGNTAKSSFSFTNGVCIGSAKDTQNDKIYWFVTADNGDFIVEHNVTDSSNAMVLIDYNSVLNFSTSNLITGVNVLDGTLMWTDDLNEPRKLLISRFKTGSSTFATHTSVYGRPFVYSDITVIKKKPNERLHFTAAASTQTGNGVGVNYVTGTKNVFETVGGLRYLREVGSAILIDLNSTVTSWGVGDIIVCQANEENTSEYDTEHEMRVVVTSIGGSGTVLNGTIQSVPAELRDIQYVWSMKKEEEAPMWPLSFPRFAYRWKYVDGEISAFSPWTEPVFIPNKFKYGGVKGYNDGMSNNLRKLTLNNWETPPADVQEIQILYKDSSDNSIYVVDKLLRTETTFEITNTLTTSLVTSDQLTRIYDNVPRKAKAQEIIGNRLVYANYLQNYTVPAGVNEGSGPSSFDTDILLTISQTNITTIKSPEPTLKSSREYQAGIVYVDINGRESPVFTNKTASKSLNISNSSKVNKISLLSSHAAPSWATHFKYYLKDVSNEYYNVSIDRYYMDPDGSLWLSMLSSERNKVQEGDYLILKKKWNVDQPVTSEHKYKVLDISNDVPDSIKIGKKLHVQTITLKGGSASLTSGSKKFNLIGPSSVQNPKFFDAFEGTTYVKLSNGVNETGYYELESAGATGLEIASSPNTDYELKSKYEFNLVKGLGADASFLPSLAASAEIRVTVYRETNESKPEYGGRFFVNINRDSGIDENILYNFTDDPTDYTAKEDILGNAAASNVGISVTDDPDVDAPGNGGVIPGDGSWGFIEHVNAASSPITPFVGNISSGNKVMQMFYAPYLTTSDGTPSGIPLNDPIATNFSVTERALLTELVAGQLIQFKSPAAAVGFNTTLYTVASVTKSTYDRQVGSTGDLDDEQGYYVEITTVEPFEETFTPTGVRVAIRSRTASTVVDEDSVVAPTSNPPVFEVEPLETVGLNLYYEISEAIPIAGLNDVVNLDYFNAYCFGNGVESDRIRDDFNAKRIGKGVRVSTTLEEPYAEERRKSGIIYSGIYNSTSGLNELNQFNAGLAITKDINPIHGGIMKLHARDTDLIALAEDKCFRVLANKDALYNADGNPNLLASDRVLGQVTPYVGEYGISKNPESFVSFGFRAYFVDKTRRSVIRLSRDGITDVTSKGMSDYIQDALSAHTGAIHGSFNEDSSAYNVTIGSETLSFKESVDGWSTRLSFVPESGISLNSFYYTFKNGNIYSHTNTTVSNFYGTQYPTSVEMIHNDEPSSVKNFKTLSYEGDDGWTATVNTDSQDGEVVTWKNKEGIFYNYIRGKADTWNNSTQVGSLDTSEFSVQGIDTLHEVTSTSPTMQIVFNNNINVSLQESTDDLIFYQKADGKVYKIGTCTDITGNTVSVDNTNSIAYTQGSHVSNISDGDFVFFVKNSQINTSGLIGYYASVEMTNATGNNKELFAVNSEIFVSS